MSLSEIWQLVLAVNSAFWVFSLSFLTYAFCMLFIALEWRQFLFACILFVAVTIVEIIMGVVTN